MKAVVFLLALFIGVWATAATPGADLKAIWLRVYSETTKTLTLTKDKLQSVALQDFFAWCSGNQELTMPTTKVDMFLDDVQAAEIDVQGSFKLWGATTNFELALWKTKDAKDFSGAIVLDITGGWSFTNALPASIVPSDSWLNLLNFVQATGHLAAASDDHTLKSGQAVQRGFVLDLAGAFAKDGSLLGMARLLQTDIKTLKLNVHAEIPFAPKTTQLGVIASGTVSLAVDSTFKLPLTASTNIIAGSFVFQVAGLQKTDIHTLTAHVAASVSAQFGTDPAVVFGMHGDWTEATQTLVLAGDMQGQWVHPFKAQWLTITQANAQATLTVGHLASLQSFSIGGAVSMVFGNWHVTGSLLSTSITPDFKSLGFEVSCAAQDANLLALIQSVMSDSTVSPAALKDLHLAEGSLKLTLMTYDGAPSKKGLTVQASVHVVGQTLSQLLAPLSKSLTDFTFSLGLYLPVFGDLKTGTTVHLALQAASIPLAPTVQLQAVDVQLDISASPAVSLAANLAVQFTNQPAAVVFGVSAAWSKASQQLDLSGGLVSSWPTPFGQKWLTIDSAKVAASISVAKPGQLRSLSLSGACSLTLSKWHVSTSFTAETNGDFSAAGLVLSTSGMHALDLTSALQALANQPALTHPAALDQISVVDDAVTIAVYNYDSPQYKKGVTLSVNVHLKGTELRNAVSKLNDDCLDLTIAFSIYLPVFSGHPFAQSDLKFSLTLPTLTITPTIKLVNTQLAFEVLNAQIPSVSADANLSVLFAGATDPVLFGVGGSWTKDAQELALNGGVRSAWVTPFGLKWLTINSATIAAKISTAPKAHKLTSLTLSGAAQIALHSGSLAAQVSADFSKDFSQITLVLSVSYGSTSTSPLQTLVQALANDESISSTALQGMKLADGSVTIAVQTWDDPASQYKKGLTVKSKVHLTSAQMQKLMAIFGSAVANVEFEVDIFLPVFNKPIFKSSDITISLHAQNIVLNPHFRFTDVSLSLDISASPSVALSCGLGVQVRDWSELTFAVTGSWSMAAQTVSLGGALSSPWVHPFGIKMITINSAAISAKFSLTAADVAKSLALSMSGSADFALKSTSSNPYTLTAAFSLNVANEFKDVAFTFTVALKSAGDLIRTALGMSPSHVMAVDDLKTKVTEATTSVFLSTYAFQDPTTGVSVKQGLTVSAAVEFIAGSPLEKRLGHLLKPTQAQLEAARTPSTLPANQQEHLRKYLSSRPPRGHRFGASFTSFAAPVYTESTNTNAEAPSENVLALPTSAPLLTSVSTTPSDVRLTVFLPIFSTQVLNGVTVSLAVENIPIKSNLVLRELGVELGLSVSISGISLKIEAALAVKFKNQPDWIVFAVAGGIDTSATVTLEGAMIGTWDHAFGLKGVQMKNLWVDVGFIPAVSLDKLGFGGNLTIGATVMSTNAYVDLTHPEDICFKGVIQHLSLRELAKTWNSMHAKAQINLNLVPDLFDLQDVELALAGETTTIQIGGQTVVTFEKGLTVICYATLLGIDKVSIKIYTDFSWSEPDFIFYVHFEFLTLYDSFVKYMNSIFHKKELQPPDLESKTQTELAKFIYDLSFIIPQMKSLEVDMFSFTEIAQGAVPEFRFTFTVFGKDHTVDIKLNFAHMLQSLSSLLEAAVIDIKNLLHLPECVINLDCKKGQVCSHASSGWKCTSGCASESGQLPLFGCVKCITSAECTHASAYGPCCNSGKCSSADKDQMCGLCWFGHQCNDPHSGCTLGFCHHCLTSLDCHWNGVAGTHCVNHLCQP